MTEAELVAIEAREQAATKMVMRLCLPASDPEHRRWEMTIPALPSRDPDLVISASLDDNRTLLAEVRRLRAALEPYADEWHWGKYYSPQGIPVRFDRVRKVPMEQPWLPAQQALAGEG